MYIVQIGLPREMKIAPNKRQCNFSLLAKKLRQGPKTEEGHPLRGNEQIHDWEKFSKSPKDEIQVFSPKTKANGSYGRRKVIH